MLALIAGCSFMLFLQQDESNSKNNVAHVLCCTNYKLNYKLQMFVKVLILKYWHIIAARA